MLAKSILKLKKLYEDNAHFKKGIADFGKIVIFNSNLPLLLPFHPPLTFLAADGHWNPMGGGRDRERMTVTK